MPANLYARQSVKKRPVKKILEKQQRSLLDRMEDIPTIHTDTDTGSSLASPVL
jgi:hypothetical protein